MIRDHRVYKTRKSNQTSLVIAFIIKILLLSYIIFQIITQTLIATVKVGSISMEPTLTQGEGIFTSPLNCGFQIPLTSLRIKGNRSPARGDILLVKAPYAEEYSFPERILDSVIRFFTLNNKSFLTNDPSSYVIKRIIALPGETVKLENHKAFILKEGSWQPESELTKKSYKLKISETHTGTWKEEFPYSGTMPPLTLAEDEYFLLGDNRTSSNDSRYFGAVKKEAFISRLLLRYHPLNKIKIP